VLLVAILTVRRTHLAEFRQFEHAAARIMAGHDGAIERAIVFDEGHDTLRELHVVRFRDANSFEAYRADPRLVELQPLRDRSVIAQEILLAHDGPKY